VYNGLPQSTLVCRRIRNILWTEHVTTKEVYQRAMIGNDKNEAVLMSNTYNEN